jgi:formate/nitrite transporter
MDQATDKPLGTIRVEASLPPEMALACEATGVEKANRDVIKLVVLGVLAGAFIAFGAMFMTVVTTGSYALPWGIAKLVGGLSFSLGLILVVVGGAELFTSDTLMSVAYASGRISLGALLRAWFWVYAGNIVGAFGTAALVFLSSQHEFSDGGVGKTALAVAATKAALPTVQVFFRAILCNVLVCLGVWMSYGARNLTDKVMVVVPAATAFVAAGFEHCIANLYFMSYGLAVKTWAEPAFWAGIHQTTADYPALTIGNALHNIAVATVGNVVGGSFMVGVVYWFAYLRRR